MPSEQAHNLAPRWPRLRRKTARAVEGRFDLRELGQQRLKGEAAASMIYAPGAERRRQQAFDETFVGREAVTANLGAGLTQPGALQQVIGPAGKKTVGR